MLSRLYAKWMYQWGNALTTRGEKPIERARGGGVEPLADFGGTEALQAIADGQTTPLDAMIALNQRIAAEPHAFYDYVTPTDFRLEQHFPELYPTNVRPETLEQE